MKGYFIGTGVSTLIIAFILVLMKYISLIL